jgi:hypothetical protein
MHRINHLVKAVQFLMDLVEFLVQRVHLRVYCVHFVMNRVDFLVFVARDASFPLIAYKDIVLT